MKKITLPTVFVSFFPVFLLVVVFGVDAFAQTGGLRIAPGVSLPGDSAARELLIDGLRGWLGAMSGPDSLNAYVAEADRPVMAVLMEELRELKADAWLGRVVQLDPMHFAAQLNYMSLHRDTPVLEACCTVLARREGDKVYLSSPLEQRTADWKSRRIGCCTFHYRTSLNFTKAAEFERTLVSYDKRVRVGTAAVDYYCCTDFLDASQLLGVEYKSLYGGMAYSDMGKNYGKGMVVVCGAEWKDGFCRMDLHDLFHNELHRVVSRKVINRPVDEGMAYLYGGSWRTYDWKDILRMMGDYRAAHPGADWLVLYKEGTNLVPPPKIIKISYIINALIVQRLEKDRGFAATLPLLCCGPKASGDANYFAALRDVTGVDEKGFNGYIEGLLKDALN